MRLVVLLLRPAALLLIAPIAIVLALPPVTRTLLPYLYREGRPTAAGRRVNRAWSWLVSSGLTPARWPGKPGIGPATLEV